MARRAGKDQSVMATVCLQRPGLCHLVPPPAGWVLTHKNQTRRNPWFYLQVTRRLLCLERL